VFGADVRAEGNAEPPAAPVGQVLEWRVERFDMTSA